MKKKKFKNILFITDNFPPETNAPAIRTFEHAREWVRKGYKVTIVTCFPNFPNGELFKGYTNKLIQTEYLDGIKVVRLWSFISSNKGFILRSLDYFSFAISSFFYAVFIKYDGIPSIYMINLFFVLGSKL